MTQKEVAAYLHISQNAYSQYETGKRGLPIDALIKLTALFQTSADYILEITDNPTPY